MNLREKLIGKRARSNRPAPGTVSPEVAAAIGRRVEIASPEWAHWDALSDEEQKQILSRVNTILKECVDWEYITLQIAVEIEYELISNGAMARVGEAARRVLHNASFGKRLDERLTLCIQDMADDVFEEQRPSLQKIVNALYEQSSVAKKIASYVDDRLQSFVAEEGASFFKRIQKAMRGGA